MKAQAIDFTSVTSRYGYFVLLCLISLLLVLLSNALFPFKEMAGSQLDSETIHHVTELREQWEWLAYASIPVLYLVKITLVCGCLSAGLILAGQQFSFGRLFFWVVIAEFIFLIVPASKLFWFTFIEPDYTPESLQYFPPLSLANLFNRQHMDKLWLYPLQLINIFELIYVLLLANFLGKIIQKPYSFRILIVMASYGLGLLCWAVCVTFLSVSLGV